MYYRHRRQNGEVFALALIVYPLTRFTIEFIRGDEMGQFGTGFTISQIVSMVIFAIGVALVGWLTFGPAHSRLPTSLRRDASSVQC
jgi:phosphatidylglycerol:prolipoprotein diacylglycerol transferase